MYNNNKMKHDYKTNQNKFNKFLKNIYLYYKTGGNT